MNLDPVDFQIGNEQVITKSVYDNGKQRVVIDGVENGLIGEKIISVKAEEKMDAASRILEIRETYINNNGNISDAELLEITNLIEEFYPDASVDDYLPPELKSGIQTRAPGDYQQVFLNFNGSAQETNYWCGPASVQTVLRHKGINASQSTLANIMGTTTNGTNLGSIQTGLNYYKGTNGLNFTYYTAYGPGDVSDGSTAAINWAIKVADTSITTLLGNYGVIYDVHQVAGSLNYLETYDQGTGRAVKTLYHYVAGEGFKSTDPDNRLCDYFDNNNSTAYALGNRHMRVLYRTMGQLTNDMGFVY